MTRTSIRLGLGYVTNINVEAVHGAESYLDHQTEIVITSALLQPESRGKHELAHTCVTVSCIHVRSCHATRHRHASSPLPSLSSLSSSAAFQVPVRLTSSRYRRRNASPTFGGRRPKSSPPRYMSASALHDELDISAIGLARVHALVGSHVASFGLISSLFVCFFISLLSYTRCLAL